MYNVHVYDIIFIFCNSLSDVNCIESFLIAKNKFKQCDDQQTIPPISTK